MLSRPFSYMPDTLLTEARHPASEDIDALSTLDMLRVINAADAEIAAAVGRELLSVGRAVDAIVERLDRGGRLIYMGAGSSGRLGVLDASECPPTFNTPPDLVIGLIAGGDAALRSSVERAEDSSEAGRADLEEHALSADDAVVGVAASGRTPYVLGGVRFARAMGAVTIGISCTRPSALADAVEIAITPLIGPEILTGSTRLRAGTATKMVLNMLSTGAMIRSGYVYGNLMVNVQPTNGKLVDRSRRIISAITGVPYDEASQLLAAGGTVRVAILMHRRKLGRAEAEALLDAHRGRLRSALQA